MRLSVIDFSDGEVCKRVPYRPALFVIQSSEGKDIGQTIMLAAGFLAACLFVLVSMAANLKFGLSLATTPFDRIIYGALSLAADLMKVALPLVARTEAEGRPQAI